MNILDDFMNNAFEILQLSPEVVSSAEYIATRKGEIHYRSDKWK